jgi:hypothetical protein
MGLGNGESMILLPLFEQAGLMRNLPLASEGLQIGGPWPSVWRVLEWIKTIPTALFQTGENSPGLVC